MRIVGSWQSVLDVAIIWRILYAMGLSLNSQVSASLQVRKTDR